MEPLHVNVCSQCYEVFWARDTATLCPHCVSSRAFAAFVALAVMFSAMAWVFW